MTVNGFNSKISTLYFFLTPVSVRREKKLFENGTIKQTIIYPYRKNTINSKALTKARLR